MPSTCRMFDNSCCNYSLHIRFQWAAIYILSGLQNSTFYLHIALIFLIDKENLFYFLGSAQALGFLFNDENSLIN